MDGLNQRRGQKKYESSGARTAGVGVYAPPVLQGIGQRVGGGGGGESCIYPVNPCDLWSFTVCFCGYCWWPVRGRGEGARGGRWDAPKGGGGGAETRAQPRRPAGYDARE